MNAREAENFLAKAVPPHSGVWADLGAGAGTFTRALANILGPGILLSACGLVFSGSGQSIQVQSSPDGTWCSMCC